MTKQIPNLFTLLNLIFGCCAIVAVLQTGVAIEYDAAGNQFIDIPEKIFMSSVFIGLAAVVDFFDGFIARLLKASSEMGKQLDSLADVVSFGVAPSMILYQFLRMGFASQENGLEVNAFYLMPAFILAAAAAYRLAKFNLDTRQTDTFIGVPTPAVGLLVASFPLIYWTTDSITVVTLLTNKWMIYGIVMLLSGLMLSPLPMMSLKIKSLNFKQHINLFVWLILCVVFAFIFHWLAVPLAFIAYIILSLLNKKKLS